jgi:hypothetical protein
VRGARTRSAPCFALFQTIALGDKPKESSSLQRTYSLPLPRGRGRDGEGEVCGEALPEIPAIDADPGGPSSWLISDNQTKSNLPGAARTAALVRALLRPREGRLFQTTHERPLPERAERAIWEGRAARRRGAPSTDRGGHRSLLMDLFLLLLRILSHSEPILPWMP